MYNTKQKTKKSIKRNNSNKVKKNKKNKKTKKVYRGGESLFESGDEIPALKSLCEQLFQRKKDSDILLNFITENIDGGILKYPTLNKGTFRSVYDYVNYTPQTRHMLIITEILKNRNTNKYDNYHYILTFDIDQFHKIKMFKNMIETYQEEIEKVKIKIIKEEKKKIIEKEKKKITLKKNNQSDVNISYNYLIDNNLIAINKLNQYNNYPTFKNVFVTNKLLIKKKSNEEKIKFINLYKCYFKYNNFIQPFIVNRKLGKEVEFFFFSPENTEMRVIPIHKVDLILSSQPNTFGFSVLTEKLLQNIIDHNEEVKESQFPTFPRNTCGNFYNEYKNMKNNLIQLISDNKNFDYNKKTNTKCFEYNLSIMSKLDSLHETCHEEIIKQKQSNQAQKQSNQKKTIVLPSLPSLQSLPCLPSTKGHYIDVIVNTNNN